MRYQLWKQEEKFEKPAGSASSETFIAVDNDYDRKRRSLHPDAKLVWEIDAETYDEAFQHLRKHLEKSPFRRENFLVDPD